MSSYGYAPHRWMYFEAFGHEHDAVCFWCETEVEMKLDMTREEALVASSGIVHHVDHDHGNNILDNFAPMHQSCHSAYHRSVRPLVAKGSKLPDEWREKVAAAVASRMSSEENKQQIAKTMAANVREDENYGKPLYCEDCGGGPYTGTLGLNSHQGREGCVKYKERLNRERDYEFECSCGDKFAFNRALTRHVNNRIGHHAVKAGLTARQREKALIKESYKFVCMCEEKFRTARGLSIHKGTSCPLKEVDYV